MYGYHDMQQASFSLLRQLHFSSQASNDSLESICYLIFAYFLELTSGGKNGGFVHQVLQISSGETRGSPCNLIKIYIFSR